MMGYQSPEKLDEWLFINHMGRQFTRQGVNYIIKKYGAMARESSPDLIPDSLSPHKMRHTAAMELVDSGVDLIYIRDLLGHVSVKTTEIYAKSEFLYKWEAAEKHYKQIGIDYGDEESFLNAVADSILINRRNKK